LEKGLYEIPYQGTSFLPIMYPTQFASAVNNGVMSKTKIQKYQVYGYQINAINEEIIIKSF